MANLGDNLQPAGVTMKENTTIVTPVDEMVGEYHRQLELRKNLEERIACAEDHLFALRTMQLMAQQAVDAYEKNGQQAEPVEKDPYRFQGHHPERS